MLLYTFLTKATHLTLFLVFTIFIYISWCLQFIYIFMRVYFKDTYPKHVLHRNLLVALEIMSSCSSKD